MTPTAALLARTQLFGRLDAGVLEELATRTRRRSYAEGQVVFVQDEPGERLFVLADGVVKLLVRSPDGEVIELARHRPPAVFGEMALLDGGPRSATAEAVEPATLLTLARQDFLDLLHGNPEVVDSLLRLLGQLVRDANEQATDLVFLDLQARVAKRLLRLGEAEAAGPGLLDRSLTQNDLARMVGAKRQTVNRVLRTLEKRGYIRMVGHRAIEIVRPEELARIAKA
jgi:CRP/FNR family transcriptional regulator, cyclic AMP receptor protein